MAAQRSTNNIDVPNRSKDTWGIAPGNYDAQIVNALNFVAGATVNAYRAVKFGADDNTVIQGAAATDTTIGVNQSPQAALAGQPVMVALQGIGTIELGGTVVRGDLLSVDSVGRGVVSLAAPTDRVIGVALQSGGSGAFIQVSIAPSKNGGVT
jgi:hypothetical protein